MTIRRLNLADLGFGEPLRWDVFGPDGAAGAAPAATPLLQKGQVIAPGAQLDDLLAAGLYAEAGPPASVLHTLSGVSKRLERMLMALLAHSDADAELRAIARELVDAVALDTDIALACIFLNQIAGLYAVRHCVETAVVVAVLARAMRQRPDDVLVATAAALTMNASMVRQTEGFQCKNCSLSHEERALVLRHPFETAELLRSAGVTDAIWLSYVLLHHENEDGSGYPTGKSGAEIPQNAKLINLADRYCAHVSARNYRRSILPDLALHKLFVDSEIAADASLASHFVEEIGKYPPGTLVRMQNGEVGVVARRHADGSLSVHALKAADGNRVPAQYVRTTQDAACTIVETLHEDQLDLRFSMKQIWGELASV